MKKLTILLVAPQPFMQDRGTPIAVRILSETLAAIGHNIHLLVYHEGENINIKGVTVHRILDLKYINNIRPGMSWKKIICDIFIFSRMLSLRKKIDFDLIHAVEESVFFAKFFKVFYGIPYVYDMDSLMSDQIIDKLSWVSSLRGIFGKIEKAAVKESLGVVAVCRALEDTVKEMVPSIRVVRLEDISLLDDSMSGTEDLKERYNISGICFLYVGNLEKYQGIDLLLQSFAIAMDGEDSAELVIIGGVDKDIKKYETMSIEFGIAECVHFIGPRHIDLLGYYLKQADILVSPRTMGSNTPMKIYSYLDSGKPILATKLSTHTQVLDENVACLVVPDKNEMANGMISLIRNDGLREQLGASGKKMAELQFSPSAYKLKLSEFYTYISQQIK